MLKIYAPNGPRQAITKMLFTWTLLSVFWLCVIAILHYLFLGMDLQTCPENTKEVSGTCYYPNGTSVAQIIVEHGPNGQIFYDLHRKEVGKFMRPLYAVVVVFSALFACVDPLCEYRNKMEELAAERVMKQKLADSHALA